MSENIIPDVVENVIQQASDVLENVENTVEPKAEKTFAELIESFKEILDDEQKMKRQKELEAIRTAFYKKLNKEKMEARLGLLKCRTPQLECWSCPKKRKECKLAVWK